MCGIVGFTTPGQDPAAAKQIVQGMADLIRHRGPDGEGCYADGTAALGIGGCRSLIWRAAASRCSMRTARW